MKSGRTFVRFAVAGLLGVVALAACSTGGTDSSVGDDGGTHTGAAGASGSGGASSGGQTGTGGVATGGNGSGGSSSAGGSGGQSHGGQGGGASGGAAGRGSGGLGGAGLGTGGMRTGGASGSGPGGAVGGAGGKSGGAGAGGRTGGAGAGGATGTGGVGGAGATGNITIWIAGDSTVANGSTPCPIGWGAELMPHFDSKVTVSNRAIGGRSVQTWLYDVSSTLGTDGECVLNSTTYQAAWTAMLAGTGMKAGDYLFIQFGINDTDSTCPRHVGTALFKTDYGMMAQAAKDRGANPIFVTPVSSIACSGSKATPTRGTFATATVQAGTQYDVPVIDLEQLSVALYTSLGFCPLPGPDTATTFESGAIGDFFCEDHTHFEAAGAVQIADLIAKALVDQGIGLAAYLK